MHFELVLKIYYEMQKQSKFIARESKSKDKIRYRFIVSFLS